MNDIPNGSTCISDAIRSMADLSMRLLGEQDGTLTDWEEQFLANIVSLWWSDEQPTVICTG